MNTKIFLASCLATFSLTQTPCMLSVSAQGLGAIGSPYKISGPFQSKNLSVFLIRGNKGTKTNNIITLQEALKDKKVVVSETGDVNNLAVQNLSNETVFIQSGDIVRGGRQDRTMQYDMILPPHSGKIPLPAFCVEHGRWEGRSAESADSFASSEYSLVGNDLKLAAKQKGDQSEVWNRVAQHTQELAKVAYAASPTMSSRHLTAAGAVSALPPPPLPLGGSGGSLELALEDKNVKKLIDQQMNELQPIANGKDDVIGYAVAINGKLKGVDLYASHDLFAKVWAKQLKSAVVEANESLKENARFKPVEPDAVGQVLAAAEKIKPSKQVESNKQTQLIDRETKEDYLSQTRDKISGSLIHENLLLKF
jgi:hypothetical protein